MHLAAVRGRLVRAISIGCFLAAHGVTAGVCVALSLLFSRVFPSVSFPSLRVCLVSGLAGALSRGCRGPPLRARRPRRRPRRRRSRACRHSRRSSRPRVSLGSPRLVAPRCGCLRMVRVSWRMRCVECAASGSKIGCPAARFARALEPAGVYAAVLRRVVAPFPVAPVPAAIADEAAKTSATSYAATSARCTIDVSARSSARACLFRVGPRPRYSGGRRGLSKVFDNRTFLA